MAVVIRLQGLPIVAGTMDIRHFFSGLTIPDGGVHIVGGEHGEAFIVFATDEDARLGMMRTGGTIKGSKVSLLLSSKTEMQNMIELSRRRFETGNLEGPAGNGGPVGGGLAGSGPPLSMGNPNHMFLGPMNPLGPMNLQAHMKPAVVNPDELFVHLHGLPFSATEMDVREFFQGLGVESVRFIRDHMGRTSGRALAKFYAPQDCYEALKRNAGMMGQRYVEITPATERQWITTSAGSGIGGGQGSSKHCSDPDQDHHRRGSSSASPSGRERARSRSPHKQEYCVYLKGLPYEAENKQIFEFFKNLDIVEDSIYIAYGPNGRATGEGFVEFRNEIDYKVALGCHMQYMGSRFIQVHPITKKGMFEKIDVIRKRMQGSQPGDQKGSSLEGGGKNARTCAHISNIPYNVSKKDVRLFLEGIQLFEESLKVLVDGNGNGLGQAVVQFRSEEEAMKAERLHRQKLNGRDAFVHLITFDQMKDVERNPPPQAKRGQKGQGSTHGQGHSQPHSYPAMAGDEYSFLRNSVGNLNNGPPFVTPFSPPGNGLGGPPPPLPPIGGALGDVSMSVPPPMVGSHLPAPVLEPPGFRPGPGSNNGPPGFVGGPESLRGLPPFDNGPRKSSGLPSRGGGQGRSGAPQPGFGPASDTLRGPSGISGGPGNPRPTIVKIQNMPFTVTVDEILDFFYGYQVLPGSVCLQYSEKGMPTGEAMVAFESHDEAMSAVLDLNDRPIGSRKVKITLG
ncbi:hypothetical protein ANANG_G00253470 [Anguilla anguilla]|uniref:RRM domain-containing protein n=1 Tax=Anguilla anguilla TaxID=7936 RepID=A0A9D3LV76_ANGAN|nr:hypothetical protein ANANG_G00253470 [Anguilla anguilla]